MESESNLIWGIDLGGTKIEAAVIDSQTGHAICRLRVPTEAELGYEHILDQVIKVIEAVEAQSGWGRGNVVGIGTPGAIDPITGLLRNSNTTCLIGKPLSRDIASLLNCTVRLANDANCFAVAESKWGAGRDANTVFGVILGTGVGGGIVIHGSVLEGCNGIAGEWGHNLLDPNGAMCYCGKRGCVETVLSGPAISRRHFEAFQEELRLELISERAAQGDSNCQATLAETSFWLGKALAAVVNIIDPDVIVLGGGVSNLKGLYTEGKKSLYEFIFHDKPATRLVQAQLGDSAGVFGAALLTLDPKLK